VLIRTDSAGIEVDLPATPYDLGISCSDANDLRVRGVLTFTARDSGLGFVFFNARISWWTDAYWNRVYITCPSWLLPETGASWLVTPILNGAYTVRLPLLLRAPGGQ
jgi:hypothetical protein